MVSSWAIENLSHDNLSGVLAHELSHHLGMHTIALTIGQWLTIPIVLLAKIGFLLQNVAHAATDVFITRSTLGSFVGFIGYISLVLGVSCFCWGSFLAYMSFTCWLICLGCLLVGLNRLFGIYVALFCFVDLCEGNLVLVRFGNV